MRASGAARFGIFVVAICAPLLASCGSSSSAGSTAPTGQNGEPVLYSVTGTAKTATISYTMPNYAIVGDPGLKLPFSFSWPTPPNQFQLVMLAAQIDTPGDTGSVQVTVYEYGNQTGTATAAAFPNTATVSYTHH